jgi:hypothetical protein
MKKAIFVALLAGFSLSCGSSLCPNTTPAAPWNAMNLTGKGGNICRSDATFITIEHSADPKAVAFPYVEELAKQGWKLTKTEGDSQTMQKDAEELEIRAYPCGEERLFGALPGNAGCVMISKRK